MVVVAEKDAVVLTKEEEEKGRRTLQATMTHMAMNVATNVVCVGARPVLLLQLLNGDAAAANQMLSTWAGGVGFAEFCVNPALGRLSDVIGRKPFLLLGPLTNFLLKSLVALFPSVNMLMLERILCGSLTTVSGSTTCSAVLSDMSTGKNLAHTGAGLGAYAGYGCLLGPLLGGQLLARTGNARVPFAVAALVALADMRAVLSNFEESLVERKEWDWQAVNPFRVLKLFQGTPAVFKRLLLSQGLMCFPEVCV
jgi:MFS family permease